MFVFYCFAGAPQRRRWHAHPGGAAVGRGGPAARTPSGWASHLSPDVAACPGHSQGGRDGRGPLAPSHGPPGVDRRWTGGKGKPLL